MIKLSLSFQIAIGVLLTLAWQPPAARADLLEASELTGVGALSAVAAPLCVTTGAAYGASVVGAGASEVGASTAEGIVKLLDNSGNNLDELSEATLEAWPTYYHYEVRTDKQVPIVTIQLQNGPKTIPLVVREGYVEMNIHDQPLKP